MYMPSVDGVVSLCPLLKEVDMPNTRLEKQLNRRNTRLTGASPSYLNFQTLHSVARDRFIIFDSNNPEVTGGKRFGPFLTATSTVGLMLDRGLPVIHIYDKL
jgi:hypothetical protein